MNKKINESRLYEAALKQFARYGFNRTKMSDVSSSLNLAAGTIYRYVGNKEDLYRKAVAYGLRRWQKSGKDAIAQYDDPLEQFIVFVGAGYEYLSTDKDLLAIIVDNPSFLSVSPQDDPFSEIHQETLAIIAQILSRGMEAGCFRNLDCASVAETFFSIYMLFVIKTYLKNEGIHAWQAGMNGLEIILMGIIDRKVGEDIPKKLLKKHQPDEFYTS